MAMESLGLVNLPFASVALVIEDLTLATMAVITLLRAGPR
jgi:hypothetical protein